MIAIFCGDRNWTNRYIITDVMGANLHTLTGVIQGEARGADLLSKEVAKKYGIRTFDFPANWNDFGKRAGPVRNQAMLDFLISHSDGDKRVYAFHNDIKNSKGTKHMCTIAKACNIPVRVYSETSLFQYVTARF